MAGLVATGTRDVRDCRAVQTPFVVTDHADDYALDCNSDAAAAIADTLGTLIKVLIEQGILNGTVTDR